MRETSLRQVVAKVWAGGVYLLHTRTIWVLTVMFGVGVAAMLWQMLWLSSSLIESSARQHARLYAEALEEFRALYTTEVVTRVEPYGIAVTHDYTTQAKAIPLPATLSMALGKRIGAKQSGAQVRLYSAYPFPWRAKGGPRDGFEREALRRLQQHPEQPVYRVEAIQGSSVLRYAMADRLRAECVGCHNSHPQSPKTDWREGDVRGVLEVILPLEQAVVQARTGLRGTFVMLGFMGLLGLSGLGLVMGKLRRTSGELEQRASALGAELTARKEVEAALWVSEQRFRTLATTAPVGIFSADAQGQCVYVNERWTQMTGLTMAEAYGSGWATTLHPADREQIVAAWQRATQTGGERGEYRFQQPDGVTTWVYGQWVVERGDAGELAGYMGTITDITARKHAEEALRTAHGELELRVTERTGELTRANRALQAEIAEHRRTEEALRQSKEAAEAANRVKSEFLATMSHELRTPLNVMLGYTDMILEDVFGAVTGGARHSLERVRQSAIELYELISVILDVNRLETGRMPVEVKEVVVAGLFQTIRDETQGLREQSGLDFGWRVADNLLPLRTDIEKLKVVLKNLISNAVKFTPTGSVTIAAEGWEGGVELRVTDTGIGIPAAELPRIFEPFQQGAAATRSEYEGSGLGLHIVKLLLELLQGTIAVESVVGQGATFRVRLPRGLVPPTDPVGSKSLGQSSSVR